MTEISIDDSSILIKRNDGVDFEIFHDHIRITKGSEEIATLPYSLPKTSRDDLPVVKVIAYEDAQNALFRATRALTKAGFPDKADQLRNRAVNDEDSYTYQGLIELILEYVRDESEV